YGNRYIIKGSATGAKRTLGCNVGFITKPQGSLLNQKLPRSCDSLNEVTLHYGNRPIFFKEQVSVI
ncbi:MAG: hypothetical protein J6T70_11970, partial [Bacteroidales bacterium]|nr:hypothetical protein [Bacteroidales bacterium]